VKITENFTNGNLRKSQNKAINKVNATFVWELIIQDESPNFNKYNNKTLLIMAYYMK